jgi:HK97 family phage prohead protease
VFNRAAQIADQDGQYSEQISPHAFDRSLAGGIQHVRAFYNHARTLHGSPSESGSVPIGTPLDIRPDGTGLLTTTGYNRTQLPDDVLEAIRNGDITGQSFSGAFRQSSPQRPPGGWLPDRSGTMPLVTRQEIDLSEYGPTPFPAYQDAEILGVRTKVQPAAADRREYVERLTDRIAQRQADELVRSTLAVPDLTGHSIRDLAAADEYAARVKRLFDAAEERCLNAETDARLTADPADAAEAGCARVRCETLRGVWTRAVEHQQRLEARPRELAWKAYQEFTPSDPGYWRPFRDFR